MSSVFSNPHGRAADAAREYVNAIVGVVGDSNPVELLAVFPQRLTAAISGLNQDVLRRPEREGKWSIAEVLNHLADTELVQSVRLRLVLAQDRPRITGFDQDAWAKRFDYRNADPRRALDRFEIVRAGNIDLLRGVAAEDWKRIGVHEERGEETLELMAKLVAGHDLVHLRQIARIKEAVGAR